MPQAFFFRRVLTVWTCFDFKVGFSVKIMQKAGVIMPINVSCVEDDTVMSNKEPVGTVSSFHMSHVNAPFVRVFLSTAFVPQSKPATGARTAAAVRQRSHACLANKQARTRTHLGHALFPPSPTYPLPRTAHHHHTARPFLFLI